MLPFRAWGEISPDKNTDRHDTTAGFTPPLLGHWSFAISCPLAPNGTAFSIRFLFVGSSFRFPLPSHARSPSRSCGSLPFEWPLQGRTCTSKSVPMLGVQQKGWNCFQPFNDCLFNYPCLPLLGPSNTEGVLVHLDFLVTATSRSQPGGIQTRSAHLLLRHMTKRHG